MDYQLLPLISSPAELKAMSDQQLVQLSQEIRDALCEIVSDRPAHFASNLGVVELCIALHQVFDFSKVDRIYVQATHPDYQPHIEWFDREMIDRMIESNTQVTITLQSR